jgi:hypothetical protein
MVENKEQLIFYRGEGAIFIGAVSSTLTRLAFKGKAGDIGLEPNPKKREQDWEFVYRVAGESQKSTRTVLYSIKAYPTEELKSAVRCKAEWTRTRSR